MRASARHAVFALLCAGAAAHADEAAPPDEFDFFDFVGVMVEQDGEWIDPIDMQDVAEPGGNDGAAAPADPADDAAVAGEE